MKYASEESYYNAYNDEEENDQELPENEIQLDSNNQKTYDELIKSFHCQEIDESNALEMMLSNQITLNLFQSLYKLKKSTEQKIFQFPCQIKVYPKIKVMMIYLIVSYDFLRIKIDLLSIKENPLYVKPDESELKRKLNIKDLNDLEEDQSVKEKQNHEGKEIICTLQLFDFFEMLDFLLTENKDNPIVISIDKNFSIIEGKSICPNVYNQEISDNTFKYNLIKNEVFGYKISPPEKIDNSEKDNNSKSNFNENDKSSDSSKVNIHINNIPSKSKFERHNVYEEESNYLEKRFLTDENGAKYIIENNDLLQLYYLMKGMEPLYFDFSSQSIGISMTNDKALFYSLAYENIKDTKSIEHISKNIKHMTILNIKSVKNHFLTDFRYGFNAFYKASPLSKFITSFYNKDDKRLLVKVSPSGKMILSFTFSDLKNDVNELNNEMENNIGISNEIINNSNENEIKNIRKNIKDRLIDDENRGNIVEMIFYPNSFDLCKG